MQTFFPTIRALKTHFAVVNNSCDEFAIKVDKAELGDVHGPAVLRFLNPTYVWSAVWDEATKDWHDLDCLSTVKLTKHSSEPLEAG
jgi:hypothetical protein